MDVNELSRFVENAAADYQTLLQETMRRCQEDDLLKRRHINMLKQMWHRHTARGTADIHRLGKGLVPVVEEVARQLVREADSSDAWYVVYPVTMRLNAAADLACQLVFAWERTP